MNWNRREYYFSWWGLHIIHCPVIWQFLNLGTMVITQQSSTHASAEYSNKLLTAPRRATPEPMAITVGTILNFPACKTITKNSLLISHQNDVL